MTIMEGTSNFIMKWQFKALSRDMATDRLGLPYTVGLSTTTFDADANGITRPTDPAYEDYIHPPAEGRHMFDIDDTIPYTFRKRNKFNWEFPASTESWGTILTFFLTVSPSYNVAVGGSITDPTYVETGTTVVFLTESVWVINYLYD